ncbi:MAG: serine/threonine-protein kinase [Rhodothermales bacterium]
MSDLSHDRRLLDLLDALSDLDPAGRSAFLDTHCADEPELRRRLERLLDEDHAEARTHDLAAFDAATEDTRAGAEAGPFTLLEKMGEGGMGTVYRARHNRLDRQVAVKFIRFGRFATEAERRRFTTEQRSLSQLAHPHIVTIFDSGFLDDNQPYFAMEYVEGMPLGAYCDAHQLSIRRRIALFIQICDAVQHAHDRLIVHRDLKPGNVLVLPDGTPKLLDFGIAKLLDADDDASAAAGTRIMTPDYAAPEQIEGGPVTVATDVYALGVVLYELLAGRRPFLQAGSRSEWLRAILETEPARPSTIVSDEAGAPRHATPARLRQTLQGDLDTIVLKALQKEPSRRYRSAREMAEDLDRYLAGRPVLARPDSVGYRAGKFVRRHRAGIAAAAVVVGILAAMGVLYAVNVTRARDEAEQARARAERVASFTLDLFRPADPNVAQGDTLTAIEILDRSSERLLPALRDEPEVLAEMLDVVGGIYGGLGRPADATPLLERSVRLRRAWADERPEELGESLAHLAEVELIGNVVDSARVHLEEAYALTVKAHGAGGVEVGGVLDLLGHTAFAQARYDDADSLFRAAIGAFDAAPVDADQAALRRGLASALNNLGGVLFMRRELASSLEALNRARSLYEAIHGDTPHTDLIVIHNSLGNAYRLTDSLDAAIREFEQALDMSRALLGRHATTATMASNLGVALLDGGCGTDVRSLFEEARSIREQVLGAGHPSLAMTVYNLGVAVQRCDGDPARAIPLLEDAERRLVAATKPNDLRVATSRHQLAEAYREVGRYGEALAKSRQALAARTAQLREPNRDIGRSYSSLALAHAAAGRPDSAEAYATLALDQFDRLDTPDIEAQRTTLRVLGEALQARRRCPDVLALFARYREALEDSGSEQAAIDRLRRTCSDS